MFDQFFRFVLTLTLLGLFYITLAIIGIEGWRFAGSDTNQHAARFLINALALLSAASLAYWLQARWVFSRRRSLAKWGQYMACLFCLWVLHELLLTVMLAVLPLSYPTVLVMSLVAGLVLAFMVCKKYIF
jgi:putative flippase GtrA